MSSAAPSSTNEPDSLSPHLQAELVMGGGTTVSADDKSTRSASGARCYGEQQLEPKEALQPARQSDHIQLLKDKAG